MSVITNTPLRKLACLWSAAFITAAFLPDQQAYTQEAATLVFEDTTPVEARSNVRRAVTPANRSRGMTARQQLQITVEPDADPSLVQTASDQHAGVEPSPIPIPDASVDAANGRSSQIDTSRFGNQYADQPAYVTGPSDLAGPWSLDGCDGYASEICGDIGCDGSCGFSICNSGACGVPPRISFINPICHPVGFAWSIFNRMQFRVTSVQYWKSEANLPVLAADEIIGPTNPVTDNNTLFGGGPLLDGSTSGIRGELTYWIDPIQERALWLRLYDSGDHTAEAFYDSATTDVISRPFRQAVPNQIASVVVGNETPLVVGNLGIALQSSLEGGDLLVRKRIVEDELVRTDFLWGYQQVRFAETLNIRTNIAPSVAQNEYFEASNQFNGGQLGLLRTAHDGCWYFDGFAKFSFGNMKRSVYIDDFDTGGLLANQDTNVGRFEDDTFVLVPELGINAGYLLTNNLHFTIGYSFLRLPKISRVEDALDPTLTVDVRVQPQVLRPAFNFTESNLSVHMLDLGLQYSY